MPEILCDVQTNKMFDHIRLFFRGLRTHYVETFSFITEYVPATKIKPHLCSRQLLENQKVLRHMHILQSPVCDNCGWIKEKKLSFVANLGQSASHTRSPLLGLGTGIQHQCIWHTAPTPTERTWPISFSHKISSVRTGDWHTAPMHMTHSTNTNTNRENWLYQKLSNEEFGIHNNYFS